MVRAMQDVQLRLKTKVSKFLVSYASSRVYPGPHHQSLGLNSVITSKNVRVVTSSREPMKTSVRSERWNRVYELTAIGSRLQMWQD